MGMEESDYDRELHGDKADTYSDIAGAAQAAQGAMSPEELVKTPLWRNPYLDPAFRDGLLDSDDDDHAGAIHDALMANGRAKWAPTEGATVEPRWRDAEGNIDWDAVADDSEAWSYYPDPNDPLAVDAWAKRVGDAAWAMRNDSRPYDTHPFSTQVPAGLVVTEADLRNDFGPGGLGERIQAMREKAAEKDAVYRLRLALTTPIPIYYATVQALGYSPYDVRADYDIATVELNWHGDTGCATCDGGGCGDCIDQGGDW